MRASASEAGDRTRNNFKPVKSLASFRKAQPMSLNESIDLKLHTPGNVSQISFHDFLPNSIAKSPQRSTNSHS